MKNHLVINVFALCLLLACNRQAAPNEAVPDSRAEELNIADFVECEDCEFEGELVNPLPDDWSDAEKEIYHVAIDFWNETTGFLFDYRMRDLYLQKGPVACHERFISVITGELQGDGGPVASEDPIRGYAWRNRFQESAIEQLRVSTPCTIETPQPPRESAAYHAWDRAVFKCIDFVFNAGDPVCFFVERPDVYLPQAASVRLRWYDSADPNGVPHLVSAHNLFFEKVDETWQFSMRR